MTLTLTLRLPPEDAWTFEGDEAATAKRWLDKHFDQMKLVEGSPDEPALVADEDGSGVGVWGLVGIKEIAAGIGRDSQTKSPTWVEIRNALLIAASAG